MIDITIKTLDSMNHQFSVQDDFTVKKFKEHIASSVNIPAESQRLIYCGRVLADDKKLTDYDVNGKVIHLVQRAPPSTNPDTGTTNSEPRSTTRNPFRTFNQAMRLDGANGNTMYLGAMAFPAEIMDAQGIQVPQSIQGLSQNRVNVWRNMLRRARMLILALENPTEQSQSTTQTQPQPSSNVNVVNVQNLENVYPMVAHALSEAMNQISDDGSSPSIINIGLPARRETSREEPPPDTSSSNSPDASMINDLLLNYTPEEGQQGAEQAESSGETSRNRARHTGSTMSNCTTVALLIDQLRDVNRRIMPYLDMYHDMMRDDAPLDNPADTQRLFNRVSELMHYLAHAYHAMSDVICDFSQPPPRTLRCRPVLIQHSAVLQAGIPIQLNMENIGRDLLHRRNQSGATETENASGSTPSAQASSTPSQQERPAGSSQSSQRTEPSRPSRVSFAPELEVVVDVNTEIIPDVEAIGSLFGGRNENNAGSRAEPEIAQNVIQSIIENIMVHHNIYPGNSRNEGRNEDNIWRNDASSQESRNDSRWRSGSDDPSGSNQVWSSTETWPTTSTNTRSTTRPHVHMASSLGGLANSMQGYFDPFLPCNSHHIRSNRRRNQTQQSETTEAASAASETESTASTTSNAENSEETPRREPTGIHSMINRLMEGEGQTNRGRNMRMVGLQRLNNDNTIVFHIPNRRNVSVFIPNRRSVSFLNPNRRNNFPRFTPFLRTLQDTIDNSAQPNLLTHLIRLVISNIRLMDFWTLDVTQIWTNLRSGLVQYVNEHLLRGDANATGARRREAIRNASERLNAQLRPAFQAFQEWISNMLTRDESNIDVIASINELNKFYFPQIIEVINEAESIFVRQFPKYLNDYIQSLASLIHNMCHPHNTTRDVIETALIALGSMVLFSVPRVDSAIHHHLIREWRSFACTVTANDPSDQSFIVRRNSGRQEDQNASSSHSQPVLTPHATPPVAAPQPPPPLQAMEIEDPETEGVPTAEQITEPLPDVIIGAEQWHNHVPSDWVPIITRDRERQRRQPSQGPLSDAYLNGMPSKRRKVVSSAKPHGNLSHVISDSMTTAMGAAGVSPIESVAEDAGSDLALRSAYKEQVKTTIEAQLKKNPDYKPEKYPNSAKLFGPKN